ncbi:MAG: protein kinase domain-containing protein, partial [Planctomycetaceae bacterium]
MSQPEEIRPATYCATQVYAASSEYLAAYEGGQQPDLDEFMGRLPPECAVHQDELLNLLLLTDAWYLKSRLGRQPSKQDLVEFYPHRADAIAKTSVARELDTGHPIEWRFGKFRVEGPIAEGRQGQVFKAFDMQLGRWVALKLAHPAAPATWTEREGRALARLNHPHILRVYEFARWNQQHVLVTEHVESGSLVDRYEHIPLAEPELIELGRQLCDAVHHLHQHDLCHRDIKPHNILAGRHPHITLIDFGLALTVDRMLNPSGECREFHGTPAFMSPEQARRDSHADPRLTDLYAVGATLLWLMTKQPPVRGRDPDEVMRNLAQGVLNQAALDEASAKYPRIAPLCAELLHPDYHRRLPSADQARRRFIAIEAKRQSQLNHKAAPLLTRNQCRLLNRRLVSSRLRSVPPLDGAPPVVRLRSTTLERGVAESDVELDPCALTVIEGYVGQGKSVFLKQLALKWQQQTDQLLLYCELRGHRGRTAAEIVSAELSDVGHNIDVSSVDAFLQQHPALLLWDGFDELSATDRVPLLAQLHSWKRRSPHLGIILVTRPGTEARYSSPANVYSMAELEHADFLPVSRHLAPDRPPEELSRMLVGDRLGIRDLMTTPAMIAGILRHFRADRTLRENTLAFYKDVFEYIARRQNESAFGTRRPLTCGWDYPVLQSFFETFA